MSERNAQEGCSACMFPPGLGVLALPKFYHKIAWGRSQDTDSVVSYAIKDALRLPEFSSAVVEDFAVGAEAFDNGTVW